MNREDFNFIKDLLAERAGWNLSEDKLYILDRKLTEIVRKNNWSSINDLLGALKRGSRTLKEELVEEMAITDTCFFRDYDVFEKFKNVIFNHLVKAKQNKKQLKIWSAGCSTGQEAYSLAMIFKEKEEFLKDWVIEIIGTDISSQSILQAQKGRYSGFEIQLGMPASLMIKYFDKDGEHWYANNELKSMINFKQYNMIDEFSFSTSFDMILCRNLLKGFDESKREEIIKKIHKTQPIGGLLYIGKDEENTKGLAKYYKPVSNIKCLYQAVPYDKNRADLAPQKKEEEAKKAPPKITRPAGL